MSFDHARGHGQKNPAVQTESDDSTGGFAPKLLDHCELRKLCPKCCRLTWMLWPTLTIWTSLCPWSLAWLHSYFRLFKLSMFCMVSESVCWPHCCFFFTLTPHTSHERFEWKAKTFSLASFRHGTFLTFVATSEWRRERFSSWSPWLKMNKPNPEVNVREIMFLSVHTPTCHFFLCFCMIGRSQIKAGAQTECDCRREAVDLLVACRNWWILSCDESSFQSCRIDYSWWFLWDNWVDLQVETQTHQVLN